MLERGNGGVRGAVHGRQLHLGIGLSAVQPTQQQGGEPFHLLQFVLVIRLDQQRMASLGAPCSRDCRPASSSRGRRRGLQLRPRGEQGAFMAERPFSGLQQATLAQLMKQLQRLQLLRRRWVTAGAFKQAGGMLIAGSRQIERQGSAGGPVQVPALKALRLLAQQAAAPSTPGPAAAAA